MIRFLHGADFHLDSAFGALPPGQAAARRRESRELALRLADYVNEHGVDLVLLAGDLFDSASPFRETGNSWPPLWDRCGPGCSSPPATTTGTAPTAPGRP